MNSDVLAKADRWLRAYVYEIDGGAPSAQAQNPVDSEGRYYLRQCGKCKVRHRHPTSEGGYVCGKCGAPWPYRDRYLLKGHVQTSRTVGAAEAAFLGRIRTDRPTVNALAEVFWSLSQGEDPWPWRVYVAAAGVGYSFRDLEARGQEILPGAPFAFSTSAISRRYHAGRAAWADGLRKAGLL